MDDVEAERPITTEVNPKQEEKISKEKESSSPANTKESPQPSGGRWRKYRPAVSAQAENEQIDKEQIEALEALGYLSGSVDAPVITGVTVYNETSAYNGLNLYVSGHAAEAILMDMEGKVLHKWARSHNEVWPEFATSRASGNHQFWRRVLLLGNGDILAIFDGIGMVKLDKNSNQIWQLRNRSHHDLQVMTDGTIHTLTRTGGVIPRILVSEPVLEDFEVVLDADGKELDRVSLLEALENSEYANLLPDMKSRELKDMFHANSIEVLDGRLADRDPAFREGNILISLRELNALTILDPRTKKIVWALTGEWRLQHHPTILPNGNMLFFDNKGARPHSRVFEIDPITAKTVWIYSGTDDAPFYSSTCGSCYRMKNGNTLITESDNGRAFELNSDDEIVWEFVNPHRGGDSGEFIATLFDVIRIQPDFPLDWLDR